MSGQEFRDLSRGGDVKRDVCRVGRGGAGWPADLDVLGRDAPDLLWWFGDPWVEGAAAVGIVGSRRATAAGLAVAHDLGRKLAGRGIVVVSGFARGIDAAAHSGAIAAGGVSVAILGCGVDIDYPRGHRGLRDGLVAHGGAVVSEFACGTEPHRGHFPRRNRIIAAMSHVVVVIEADERSGALSTARWAADLGRDILAMPGPLHSPASRGTNRLIRDGVRPYLEIQDVLEVLGLADLAVGPPTKPADHGIDPIVGLASGGPTHPDVVAAQLGLGPRELAVRLAELEFSGRIRSLPGGLIEASARL